MVVWIQRFYLKKKKLFNINKLYGEFLKRNCIKYFNIQPCCEIIINEEDIKENNKNKKFDTYINIFKKYINYAVKKHYFILLIYKTKMFHIAGILINTEKKFIEYFDSMPSEQSYIIDSYFKNIIKYFKGFKYFGIDAIYGNINNKFYTETGFNTHEFPPPQSTENQLINISEYYKEINKKITDVNIKNFIKNYNTYNGGTCIFWTFHVINKTVNKNITIKEFIRNSNWYKNSITYYEIGIKIIKYITNEITNNILTCIKKELNKNKK